jgi:TFIIF-interacting CTD phosphatase-like protein
MNLNLNNNMYKINLVLDLDETLIHCVDSMYNNSLDQLINKEYFFFNIKCNEKNLSIFYRPYLFKFLDSVKDKFNLYIYTTANRIYADIIIKKICQVLSTDVTIFKNIICRNETNIKYKDLNNLGISTHNSIILDDRNDIWLSNNENLILIKPYYGPKTIDYQQDNELEDKLGILLKIKYIYEAFEINNMEMHIKLIIKQCKNDSYNMEIEYNKIVENDVDMDTSDL